MSGWLKGLAGFGTGFANGYLMTKQYQSKKPTEEDASKAGGATGEMPEGSPDTSAALPSASSKAPEAEVGKTWKDDLDIVQLPQEEDYIGSFKHFSESEDKP